MQTRTSHSHVTFRQAFRLPGMDASAPAGIYKVALEEERLDTLTAQVWRQTAVILQITTAGITEHVSVDPEALRDALLRDPLLNDPLLGDPLPGEEGEPAAAPQRTRPVLGMRRR